MRKAVLLLLVLFVLACGGFAIAQVRYTAPSIVSRYTTLRDNSMVKLYTVNSAHAFLVKTYNPNDGSVTSYVSALSTENLTAWRGDLVAIIAQIDSVLSDATDAPVKNDLADGYIPAEWE